MIEQDKIASIIDHTLLKPEATSEMIQTLCEEAIEHGFKSVCVHPYWVKKAAFCLKNSKVLVSTVIGFPLGATYLECKTRECCLTLEDGASEFDMVINIGALKSKDSDFVLREIQAVVKAVKGRTVKVILETCLLNETEKRLGCRLAKDAGAHFVKTSTGFSLKGATIEDVRLMRSEVGDHMGIKAAGGIRDLKTALLMVESGASRLGTSSGVAMLKELTTPENFDAPY
jgi:deoxyribose-phosphate aldolase